MKNLKIARELFKIAEDLVYADSDYIYDPDHKQHPGGGYHKTEKGWSNLDEKSEKGSPKGNNEVSSLLKKMNLSDEDIKQTMEAESFLKVVCDGKLISKEKAKKQMGDEAYWNGVTRAAFHTTSSPSTDDGHEYYFDCKEYFGKPSSIKNFITPKMTKKQKELDEKARSKNSGEVWSVAKNPKTHPSTLDYLSYNQDWDIRLQVADNPNTSNKTLHRMKNDVDDYVKDHASFALSKRKNKALSDNGFDITNLSPEMRERVKDWDAEDIAKFIGWLKEHKG